MDKNNHTVKLRLSPGWLTNKNCWLLSTDEINSLWDGDWWEFKKRPPGNISAQTIPKSAFTEATPIYQNRLRVPRITQMVIPTETDDDGKIKISITVDRHE